MRFHSGRRRAKNVTNLGETGQVQDSAKKRADEMQARSKTRTRRGRTPRKRRMEGGCPEVSGGLGNAVRRKEIATRRRERAERLVFSPESTLGPVEPTTFVSSRSPGVVEDRFGRGNGAVKRCAARREKRGEPAGCSYSVKRVKVARVHTGRGSLFSPGLSLSRRRPLFSSLVSRNCRTLAHLSGERSGLARGNLSHYVRSSPPSVGRQFRIGSANRAPCNSSRGLPRVFRADR